MPAKYRQKSEKKQVGLPPAWMRAGLKSVHERNNRTETEVKFLLAREDWQKSALCASMAERQSILQAYLDYEDLNAALSQDWAGQCRNYTEWRIRRKGERYFFTAKTDIASSSVSRAELEHEIDKAQFDILLQREQGRLQPRIVDKTRCSAEIKVGQFKVLFEADDYHQVGGGQHGDFDFVTLEAEVSDESIALYLSSALALDQNLAVLAKATLLSPFSEFKNKNLALRGFPETTHHKLLDWVRQVPATAPSKFNFSLAGASYAAVQERLQEAQRQHEHLTSEGYTPDTYYQAAAALRPLEPFAFPVGRSLGRSSSQPAIGARDASGSGWFRDLQTIMSSTPFLRLFKKPQIFRLGRGSGNTTTRGQHSLDVIGISSQISSALGLNTGMAMAAAALHDLGHSPGGHVGEELFAEVFGEKFEHHIFSLSLSELFELGLLREVELCAFFHKSGGKNLAAPAGYPEEFGVVRTADKIAYTPWDVFDSVANSFLLKDELPAEVFRIMGDQPQAWVDAMVAAVIGESARSGQIQFTEASGEVFSQFKAARGAVYSQVHSRISWNRFQQDFVMVADFVRDKWPELPPVPIVAYMSDTELENLAAYLEANPKGRNIKDGDLEFMRFEFTEIIPRLRLAFERFPERIYYNSTGIQQSDEIN